MVPDRLLLFVFAAGASVFVLMALIATHPF
jgi:hypothetical protein